MKEKNFRTLLYSFVLSSVAVAMYQGVYKNYLLDHLSFSPTQYGWVDGMKELPGLFAVGIVLIASRFTPKAVWICSLIVIAAGLVLYAVSDNMLFIIIFTLIYSTGTHLRGIQGDYLVTDFSTERDRSYKFGLIASYNAVASLLGMGLVWGISTVSSFETIFIISSIFASVSTIAGLKIVQAKSYSSPTVKLVFKRAYTSYYLLTILSATREMFFITFGTLLLVETFNTSVQLMALLMAAHSICAVITRPLVGKAIQRWGEGRALAVNYILVTFVFVGYALFDYVYLIYFLFIIDDVLVGFDDIGISSFVGRLVPRDELSATLAMGSTIAHVVAVCIPILGAVVWTMFGSIIIFLIGAIVTIIAALFSFKLTNFKPI
ncbi:MFS transporter [Cytobacillus sp. IB215316]|uniref:MFS transporter n=1 Tax=Cytobacillus sp. IB215316 TaxID=3097354 RepID=UPI002A12DE9D|nr:MFS transporter [Cytobacillus sp. IB215316]MDX8361219.1 MFS transporter [Cytobacillus sp. IB215316]